jgi:hypothetical protein
MEVLTGMERSAGRHQTGAEKTAGAPNAPRTRAYSRQESASGAAHLDGQPTIQENGPNQNADQRNESGAIAVSAQRAAIWGVFADYEVKRPRRSNGPLATARRSDERQPQNQYRQSS